MEARIRVRSKFLRTCARLKLGSINEMILYVTVSNAEYRGFTSCGGVCPELVT